jgi:hypothetical protein
MAQSESQKFSVFQNPLFLLFIALSVILFSTACGTSTSANTQNSQTFSGNTNVTVLLSGTANDQFTEFGLTFNSITLTNKSGAAVTLLSSPQTGEYGEFIHLNGTMEPLTSISVPQGIYTSATANIGYASFTCVTVIPQTDPNNPGGLLTATFAYGATPSANVTVSLPSPITVTGNNMGLVFNLAVAQSASLGSCYSPSGTLASYSITPTFAVTPIISAPETGLNGEITSLDAATNSITMTLADGQSLLVNANNNTVYQGIAGFSALSPGMLITADANFQTDGTHVVQRIAVQNADTSTITDLIGPILQTSSTGPTGAGPSAFFFGPQSQGFLDSPGIINESGFDLSQATFQISGALSNLNSLPFVPSFNATNFVAGQSVYVTTEVTAMIGPGYPPATTASLVPQVINGTVNSTSSSGAFKVYTVTLASYDLFPTLAVQQGHPALLNSPSTVEVYVDSNTKQNNSTPLALGSTLRFEGLVFNDNGTLRMDCSQVNDGITGSSTSNAAIRFAPAAAAKIVRHSAPGRVEQTIITNTIH